MKSPLTNRLAALAVSIFMTFATVDLIANHALPETPAAQLAQTAPRG